MPAKRKLNRPRIRHFNQFARPRKGEDPRVVLRDLNIAPLAHLANTNSIHDCYGKEPSGSACLGRVKLYRDEDGKVHRWHHVAQGVLR